MLFCKPKEDKCRDHLNQKPINILITNVCDLACGGCHQHCGRIPKDKLFFIDEVELKWVIDWILAHTKASSIGILGGEPTIHPKYNAFLDLFRTYKGKTHFTIFTNNRLKVYNVEENINYYIAPKDNPEDRFVPTLVAPVDVYGEQDKIWYWHNLTKKHCYMWSNCNSLIIQKRAYLCEASGAIDTLTGENHGWELKWGENAFDHSEEEISEQASHFCYRCAWCLPDDVKDKFHQRISDSTLVTISNINLLKKDIVVVNT